MRASWLRNKSRTCSDLITNLSLDKNLDTSSRIPRELRSELFARAYCVCVTIYIVTKNSFRFNKSLFKLHQQLQCVSRQVHILNIVSVEDSRIHTNIHNFVWFASLFVGDCK